jgi:endonuclease YncB( thermonuclease family)
LAIVGLLAGSAIDAAAQDSPLSSAPLPISACRFAIVGAGKVANILDGRTFMLDNGREVRMAAVEAPSPPEPAETEALAPAAAAAKAALAALLAGQSVELRHATSATDRYGRTLAHVSISPRMGLSARPGGNAGPRLCPREHPYRELGLRG